MKNLKIMAIILVAMMTMALGLGSFAATITINQKNTDGTAGAETYNLYKIFDVTQNASAAAGYAEASSYVDGTTYYTKTETYTAMDGLTGFVSGVTYYKNTGTADTPVYTAVGSSETYNSSVTYFTKTETYTEATGLTAFAEGTKYYTKSATGTNVETTDGTLGAGTDTGYSYTISTSNLWFAKLGTVGPDGTWTKASGQNWVTLTKQAGSDIVYNVTWAGENTGDAAKAFAEWLLANKGDIVADKTMTASNGSASTTVDNGYYLITSTLGTNLVLATTDINITTKNDYTTTEKTVEKSNYNVGDFVKYTITVDLPASIDYTKTVTVHDTMDNVLKLVTSNTGDNAWSAKVGETVFTSNVTLSTDRTDKHDGSNHEVGTNQVGYDFVLDITSLAPTGTATAEAKTVTITYYAEVTSDALADNGYINKEFVEYSGYETVPSEVEVETYDIDLEKLFEGDRTNTSLEATFQLFASTSEGKSSTPLTLKEETKYEKYVKVDSEDTDVTNTTIYVKQGTIANIRGLSAGTYYLTELTTSNGYNLLTGDVTITIDEDGNVTYEGSSTGSGYTSAADKTFDQYETYYTKTTSETVYEEITPNVTSDSFAAYKAAGNLYTGDDSTKTTVTGDYDPDARYFIGTATDTYTAASGVTSENFDSQKANLYVRNTVEILNQSGSILPSTGGIGTTIFYVVGAVLVIGSGIVLVTKKRMGKEEN